MNWYDTHIPNRFAAENPFRGMRAETVELPDFKTARELLPEPFWAGHRHAVDCYWKVWEIAFRNLRNPTPENGFISPYIDTAFNGNLFMWDSAFILMFCRYGRRAFNFQRTLDNLYCKQHADGFICREIRETDGSDCFMRFDPPATGPDTLAWAEWEYYANFGDRQRLAQVFPALMAYHQWMRRYRTWQDGTYWATGWACGMDNQPRLRTNEDETAPDNFRPLEWWDNDKMSWIDACLQAVYSGKILLRMAGELGRATEADDIRAEIERLAATINTTMWSQGDGFYYDRREDGTLSDVKTVGAFWSLLAGCTPPHKLDAFIAHLEDEAEFNRPHRVPTLSADHPLYNPAGGYWRGSVWPPTNYMVLRGLTQNGYHDLAHAIGMNHHKQVVQVFEQTGTVWENYAPEKADRGSIAARDFVGWGGLPPVAVFFEYVLGLRADVPRRKLTWDLRLTDAHGVRRYPFGLDGVLDLECTARGSVREKPVVTIRSNVALMLELVWEGGREELRVDPF
jgi:hypothetical protein